MVKLWQFNTIDNDGFESFCSLFPQKLSVETRYIYIYIYKKWQDSSSAQLAMTDLQEFVAYSLRSSL